MRIVSRLVKSGYTALFAGGFVRDTLLFGESDGDIDIVTNATPSAVTELFLHTIGVGAKFGVVVVMQDGIPFEVATFRSDIGIADGRHPEKVVYAEARQDAERRDFTINGMFYDPDSKKILDYVGGRADLDAHLIRAIGDPDKRFQEDFLRLLRAIRFSARFRFPIHDETWRAIMTHAGTINRISPERIFGELDRMLRQSNPGRAVQLLAEAGLLREVLPEVNDCIGIEQPPEFHPEGDVFAHTVKALELMGPEPSSTLAWSVLLHDIGKPPTMRKTDRTRFNGHDQAGARMARALLKRLRASNDLIDSVGTCIEHHMHFMHVTTMRLSTLKKTLSRPTIGSEIELHRVDCLASHGNIDNVVFVEKHLADLELERLKPQPLLRGTDLIRLGLTPGPIFSTILKEIYDLQLDETITSSEEAIAAVRVRWIDGKQDPGAAGTGTME
jgi:putative nucleotidyltransferase with HDIG domain